MILGHSYIKEQQQVYNYITYTLQCITFESDYTTSSQKQ